LIRINASEVGGRDSAPMKNDLLQRYGGPAPRYTSYPTAPHFSDAVDEVVYRDHLSRLPEDKPVSLYIHVPYCDTLCWFCGCHTKITQRYKPVGRYVDTLIRELELLSEALGRRHPISHMHWGGGSPTLLTPEDSIKLAAAATALFPIEDGYEFAVEIDPRETGEDRITALAEAGLTRASIGVQDFDPVVQKAINREQGYDITADAVRALRGHGVNSLNLDLMYGLPYQTLERTLDTIEQALTLKPDRVALFGYAHVPWMKSHQRLIPDESLPGPDERLTAAEASGEMLEAAGYVRIGIDHFALPGDSMAIAHANGTLRRNFQGYTTDTAETLLAVGASAIGRMADLFIQNEPSLKTYAARIEAGELPVTKGIALNADDRFRAAVIERLMCDFEVDLGACRADATDAPDDIDLEAPELVAMERDGLIDRDGARLIIREAGKPYVRQVAACFDAYLGRGAARHSSTV
jgi:oxygen-independent coproporphyrinogen-3 oxidase